jgi:NAD+ synthase (glutamine-hydrolysing)
VPFLYVNNVGIQNNGKGYFLFEGHSTVYNRDGSLVVTGSPYKEEVIDILVPSKKRVGIPLRKPYDKEDTVKLYRGLVYGLKKYFESQGFKKAVIGLSGGIDSAVDAALLSAALGPENVYAVNLPSKFNSDLTRSAASLMAKNLGIHYSVIPIQESVDLTVADLKKAGFEISSLGLENIQARDRGSRILAAVAASIGGLLINNGNKTEIGLNYCTLYGDTDGAIAPLGDIYKEEIYDLARYINKNAGRKIIPEAIINVMPSAELSAEQDVTKGKGDPIIYPIHDKYIKAFIEFRKNPEDLLRLYISGRLEAELRIPKGLIKKSFPTTKLFIEDLEKRWMALRQIFKRVQGTAIIVVSKRAFGFDLQESQPQDSVYFTRKYREMKKKLLKSG